MPAGVAAAAACSGDLKRLAAMLTLISGAILGQRFMTLSWLAQLDERYTASAFVERRMRWRHARRQWVRRIAPGTSTIARVAIGLLASVVAIVAFADAYGWALPAQHPPTWLLVVRVTTHALCYLAFAALCFSIVARTCIRDWDQAAASPLCGSAIISSADLAARFAREDAITIAGILWVLSFILGTLG